MLVVVLIIGILSAIALPQYEKAVTKARFAEAFVNLKALSQAVKVCELETGTVATARIDSICSQFSNLNIGFSCDSGDEFNCNKGDFLYRATDVDGNGTASASWRKGDICLCVNEKGEVVGAQNSDGCAPEVDYDLLKMIGVAENSAQCVCC